MENFHGLEKRGIPFDIRCVMRDASAMRTTLDIETDVLLAVKDISRQRHIPAGRLVSEMVRTCLSSVGTDTGGRKRNGVPLFPVRANSSVVTMDLVNRLRDETP